MVMVHSVELSNKRKWTGSRGWVPAFIS